MKYIRVASKLARVVKEINLAILTLKIDNKFLKSPIITEMSEFAFFNFNNIPTRSNPVKIHLNLRPFTGFLLWSSIFEKTILISGICLKVKTRVFISICRTCTKGLPRDGLTSQGEAEKLAAVSGKTN